MPPIPSSGWWTSGEGFGSIGRSSGVTAGGVNSSSTSSAGGSRPWSATPERRSPFYRDLYAAAAEAEDDVALEDLPILTKTMMMENWDRVVTDPRLRLGEVRTHVAGLIGDENYPW